MNKKDAIYYGFNFFIWLNNNFTYKMACEIFECDENEIYSIAFHIYEKYTLTEQNALRFFNSLDVLNQNLLIDFYNKNIYSN